MCNFNHLTQDEKDNLKIQIQDIIGKMGGLNFFLSFIEKMRLIKPHPLSARNSKVSIERFEISWDKVIFLDKVTLLESTIKSNKDENGYVIKFNKDDKKSKNIVNLIRTLSVITFNFKVSNSIPSIEFKIFNKIDESSAELNPLFVTLFFCYVNFVKNVLKD
jgi:hypothetical protein